MWICRICKSIFHNRSSGFYVSEHCTPLWNQRSNEQFLEESGNSKQTSKREIEQAVKVKITSRSGSPGTVLCTDEVRTIDAGRTKQERAIHEQWRNDPASGKVKSLQHGGMQCNSSLSARTQRVEHIYLLMWVCLVECAVCRRLPRWLAAGPAHRAAYCSRTLLEK